MSEPIRRLDESFVAELEKILAWAVEQGVSPHSRFHTYRRTIAKLNQPRTESETRALYEKYESAKRLPEVASTYSECIELLETIPTMQQAGTHIPSDLLRKAFSGPPDAFQETDTTNAARNAMFELKMGAMAARNGWRPTLGPNKPDVMFEFEGRCVKMECKRVLSVKAIEGRLKEGARQLDKCVNETTDDVGIVALSLTKLAADPNELFQHSSEPHEALSQQVHDVLKLNEQFLGGLRRPSLTGFLFYTSVIFGVPGRGFTVANNGTMFPVNLKEQSYLSRLCAATSV